MKPIAHEVITVALWASVIFINARTQTSAYYLLERIRTAMILFYLSLFLAPVTAWLVARAWRPNFRWTIAGITFGLIAYPFFVGLWIPLLYVGHPIGLISSEVMLFHMSPGQELVRTIVGHRRLIGVESLWVYALNAINWGIVYGLIGWFIDRGFFQNGKKKPLLLLAIPALIYFFPLSKATIEAAIWKKNNPSGAVCFHLMNAESNAHVYFDIGTPPRIQLTRFGSGLSGSTPYCGNYGLSLNPLTIQVYAATESNRANRRAVSDDAPSEPFAIQVVAEGKTCVGIYPNHAHSPPMWIPKTVDCALTNQSTGLAATSAASR